MTTVLVVPPEGILEVLQSDKPINARAWLEDHGEGIYTSLDINIAGAQHGTVDFLVQEDGPMNSRAREVLASLTGVHVVLTGNVAFTGLHPDTVMELVQEVG